MTLNAAGLSTVGTWLSLVEHSLGVRGVGSSNLPVPTIYSRSLTEVSVGIALETADPRSTPRSKHREAMRPKKACEGRREAALRSSNLPVPTIYSIHIDDVCAFSALENCRPRSTPRSKHREAMRPRKFCEGSVAVVVQICPSRPFTP
jgi:hypothetical protein